MSKTETKLNPEEIAIKVEGIYKDFDLPHEKQNSLKYKLIHPLKSRGTFEKQHALKDISFEIKKGEFFGIVGRNGSGKSTLLKILAEIYTPTKGKVTVNGSLTPFIELGVGFNPELTGRENVYLNGAMLGFNTKEMEKMYDEIVEFAELEKFMDQKLKNYSSGMQVRLAFSVAIRAKSDILLLDEVLAVGDADFQRKCYNYFKTLKKNGQTVILVTHDMNAIRQYCTKAVMIESSKNKIIGSPDKVATEYLRLFQNNGQSAKGTSERRWGDKFATFNNIKAYITEEEVKFIVKIKVNHKLTNPIIGFRIKNAEGIVITGTNTNIENIKPGTLKANSIKILKWSISNVFAEGTYTVDWAIVNEDGLTNHDNWEDSLGFEITRSSSSPYLISPKVKIIIK